MSAVPVIRASQLLFVAFLFALLQPALPNPFLLEPARAWTLLCYAFAIPVVLIQYPRRDRWQPTPFDWALGVYLVCVLATWPTSVNRHATGIAIVMLLGQVGVFYAVRLLAAGWPAAGRVAIAAFVVGIALVEWIAADFHFRYGLSERLINFPSLEWNGRAGLGYAAAIECALLVGIWQQARSKTVQISAIVLLIVGVAELIFLYARAPWIATAAVLLLAAVMAVRIGGMRRYAVAVGIFVLVLGLVRSPFLVHLAKMAAGLEQGPEGGLGWRLGAWSNALNVIGAHPLAGLGLGNYVAVRLTTVAASAALVPLQQITLLHPHNILLQQMAEVGIVGGCAYVALWATAHWAGWQTSVRARYVVGPTLAVFYALVAIAVMNMGENMFLDAVAPERARLHTVAWILMAVVVAEWTRPRPFDEPADRAPAGQGPYRVPFAVACLVLIAYNLWAGFGRETPAMSIEGRHRRLLYEFGQGAPVSQAFLMVDHDLTAFDVQFAADDPLTLLVHCEVSRIDRPESGEAVALYDWFATIKRVSGVQWRRISLPAVENSYGQVYLLRLQLVEAVPAADVLSPQAHDATSDRRPRVAVVGSRENISGGGSLWIAGQRQVGSLSLRAFTRARTSFARFRADVAPTLPSAFGNPFVALIILIAYQAALAIIVYALLDPRF